MTNPSNWLRSLLITGILGFVVPPALFSIFLLCLTVLTYIPILQKLSEAGANILISFLTIFGNGSLTHGLFTIGVTCSLVAMLFDTFTLYRHQSLREE